VRRFTSVAKRLFRKFTTKKATGVPNPLRFRPKLEACEDRTVPSVVTIVAVSDAAEVGTTGVQRLSRTGDTSSALTINYSVGGTATSGSDYVPLSGTVTFAVGSATADVNLAPVADAVYDPDETVSLTVLAGSGYTVGSAATATLATADDIDAVQTLIHQETFQLTAANGTVNVSLSVTLNAPGAPGLYKWEYVVTNPYSNGTLLTTFAVPVSEMDADVTNATGTNGWMGFVGPNGVTWNGPGVPPGQSVTLSFTTAPRDVGPATVSATGTGGFLAAQPTAPAPRVKAELPQVPQVNLSFTTGANSYTLRLDLTPSVGLALTSGNLVINQSTGEAARDSVLTFLKNNGWAVERAGGTGITIRGKVQADGTIAVVKSLQYKQSNTTIGSAAFTGFGQVDVTVLP
jgi:Calx-beta domain